MRGTIALLLLLAAGCASGPDPDDAPPAPIRIAVIAAPSQGPGELENGWSRGDLLLEAATLLSAETGLELCVVPGPLLVEGADAETYETLSGALGSVACPVFASPTPREKVVELEEALEAARVRVIAAGSPFGPVSPDGEWTLVAKAPDGANFRLTVQVQGYEGPLDASARLTLQTGDQVSLTSDGQTLLLTLPPLTTPPHLFALVTIDAASTASVELRSVTGDPAPQPPAPQRIPR